MSAENSSPTLLLLDGHSLAFRAFFALPADTITTSTGQSTNAILGFARMLANLIAGEEPTHVAVAFDLDGPTFRSEQYTEYKAGRASTPEAFGPQIPLMKELLGAMGIPVVTAPGFEADDVLATLATQAAEQGMNALVVTGDRDAIQLVNERVTVLYPVKGVSEMDRLTPERVQEKYGLEPAAYPDMAALVGETADNLPGIPGVGNKTAIKWLTKYGSLDALLDQADTVGGKVGEKLRENIDEVRRNRTLNRLLTDLELPITVAQTERGGADVAAMEQLLDTLEMHSIRPALFAAVGAEPSEADHVKGPEVTLVAPTKEGLAHVVAACADAPPALMLATDDGDPFIVVAVADGTAWVARASECGSADHLSAVLEGVVCHGGKAIRHGLASLGLECPSIIGDIELMAYLVDPDRRARSLDDLALRHLHQSLPEATGADQGQLDVLTDDSAKREAFAARGRATAALYGELLPTIDEHGARKLLSDMELPVQELLFRMEQVGIAVDADHLQTLDDEFGARAEELRSQACELVGEQINLGSPKQLQKVLFETLDMPKTKKIKSGYSTDADSIADLFAKSPHPFLEMLLGHREVTKQRTIVAGLRKAIADDGRIHTRFGQTAAATGRLSSTEPNLQNIPVRTPEGRRIREGFVVGEGYDVLLSADYSQIELRIMAHLSGDPGLQEAFRSGEDLHAFVGSYIFGVDPTDVTPDMRSKVKAMSYGLAYGLSSFGLSKQLRISDSEARALMDTYFERFDGIRTYLTTVVEQARKVGYTETMFGRRRYLPDLLSSNRQRREIAERAALNAPIQGTAADIMKRAMLAIDEALRLKGAQSRLLLQVHDEAIVEVAPGELDDVMTWVSDAMASAATLDVPLDVSTGVGKTWDSAAH